MAKKPTRKEGEQIHVRPTNTKLLPALRKEAAAKNGGVGPEWSLNAYVLHLLETHPERAKKS